MPNKKAPSAKASYMRKVVASKGGGAGSKRRSTGMEMPGRGWPNPPRRPGRSPFPGASIIGGGTTRPRPVRGPDEMRRQAKNVRDWKAIGELGNAYSKWLNGLAKQNPKPVRGGGGMAPSKKAKKR